MWHYLGNSSEGEKVNYLESFRSYLKERKSVLTTKNYLNTLQHYLAYLKGREPDERNVDEFLTYMSHKGNSAKSVNRHLAALRCFFKHVLRVKLEIEGYRTDKYLPIWLDGDEQNKLKSVCESTLEKALVAVFLESGLRVSEMESLAIKNVDENGYLKVMGKGGKEAVVAVSQKTLDAIWNYIGSRRGDGTGRVFPRGARAIEEIIRDLGKRAHLGRKITPHTLRHSCASRMADEGFTVVEVRDQLRHANIATTNIYFHSKPSKIKEKLEKLHAIS